MKKALPLFLLSAIAVALAVRYFSPDFSWLTGASSTEDSGNISEMSQPLPHAVMPSLDGDWVNLETYKGSVVLINFWTTWCSGCREEMPELIKLQNQFGAKGFKVVAIAVDDEGEQSVKDFVQNEQFTVDGASAAINFPVLLGHDEVARKLGFEGGLPASVLITRGGNEVKIIRGPANAKAVSPLIKRLL